MVSRSPRSIGKGPETRSKQEILSRLFGQFLGVYQSNRANWPDWYDTQLPFSYVDATAGCGLYDGIEGSPLVFLREVQKFDLPFEAYFFEKNAESYRRLILATDVLDYDQVVVIQGKYQEFLSVSGIPFRGFGLLYVDPNGPKEFHVEAIVRFLRRRPKMDLVLRLASTALKRANMERLSYYTKIIPKEKWLFTKAREGDPFRWCFMIGTSREAPLRKSPSIGLDFTDSDDPETQLAWLMHNYTKEELKNG